MRPLVTVQAVAEILCVDELTVIKITDKRILTAIMINGELRYRESDLEKYIEESKYEPGRLPASQGPTSGNGSGNGKRTVSAVGGRATFMASGHIGDDEVAVWMGGMRYPTRFTKSFFEDLLKSFRGRTVRLGTSFSGPEAGSLGAWVQNRQQTKMNPTYAVAGLLIEAGYAERVRPGYIQVFETRRA